ncbi:uncharacterized protein LOC114750111 [Neltuma alba]|uniref:uncharacterized protein LOC114750111 n=1 Tax=Neltuma alba TaxID=207710 RepID=UPI0010A4B2E2|nr:uncharacterized protein LOC114750111 [Prosopis alba]
MATPTSTEEADALERSRKKVRMGESHAPKGRAVVPRVEDWMEEEQSGENAEGSRKTYREACSKEASSDDDLDDEGEWWRDGGWESCIAVTRTPKGPNITLLPEFKARLAKRWRKSLIINVLGRMVREDILAYKLEQIWGDVKPIDIGSGFFLVECKSKEIYDRALTGGPWLIFDHYINVQPWKEDFDPEEEEITSVAAWVRITRLPMDYYDPGILYVVGSQIGTVLKVDRNTDKRLKGRFARICVQIDLKKPLQPCILVNGKAKKVEYEGLHLICFKCGKYGHDSDHCQESTTQMVPPSNHTESKTSANATESGTSPMPEYGGWMVVQRPWKGRRPGGAEGKGRDARRGNRDSNTQNNGSRFVALEMDTREDFVEQRSHGNGPKLADYFPSRETINGLKKGTKTQKNKDPVTKRNNDGHKDSESPMDTYIKAKTRVGLDEPNMSQAIVLRPTEQDNNPEKNKALSRLSRDAVNLELNGMLRTDDDPIDPGSSSGAQFLIRQNPLSQTDVDELMLDQGPGSDVHGQ